jgi:competence protein ComEC
MSLLLINVAIHHYQSPPEKLPITTLTVQMDTISINGDQLAFIGNADRHRYQCFYQLETEEEKERWEQQYKQVVLEVDASLEEPEGQRNFKGFDYQAYLKTQGIHWLVDIEDIKSVRIQPRWSLEVLRRQALVWCQTKFPEPMRHYMTGLLFGELNKDFQDMRDVYTKLGIIHLFALSGMQVDFFMRLIRRGFLRLGLTQDLLKWIQLPISVIYSGLTGHSISVQRSLVQANLSNWGITGYDNLAITLIVLLLKDPFCLQTVGGQLSLAFALITTITNGSPFSLALTSLPFLLLNFGYVHPFSIGLTAALGVIFDYLLLPGLTLVFLISPIVNFSQLNPLFTGVEHALTWIQSLMPYPLVVGKPSFEACLMMVVAVAIILQANFTKKVRYATATILIFLLLMTKYALAPSITMVDVGQGDAILLQDKATSILIDTGGRLTFTEEKWQEGHQTPNAERTLIPYLQARGIGRLDLLVLTHADTDHVGDLLALAQHIRIKTIWLTEGMLTDKSLQQQLNQIKTKIQTVKPGTSTPIFNTQLTVLAPETSKDGGNQDSIVLYGDFYNKQFLFTGDLEEQGEAALIQTYPNLQADILKVGHHGSDTSTSAALISKIRPEIALISVGKDNRYGHPTGQTLDRLKANRTKIYRTDQNGAIRLTYHAHHWKITSVK